MGDAWSLQTRKALETLFFFGFCIRPIVDCVVCFVMSLNYHFSTKHDGGVPLRAFAKDTASDLAGFDFTLSFMLTSKQDAVNT